MICIKYLAKAFETGLVNHATSYILQNNFCLKKIFLILHHAYFFAWFAVKIEEIEDVSSNE